MPKEILAAGPLLERLAREVPDKLGAKPVLLVWGMKDFAFRPGPNVPRMRAAFTDHEFVALPDAKHERIGGSAAGEGRVVNYP
jgi:haloalkane dehalogenase